MSSVFNITFRLRRTEVPIRNDHCLESGAVGELVSRIPLATADLAPTGENGSRYAELSISWGHTTREDEGHIRYETDDSEDELEEQDIEFRRKCKFCALLGVECEERTPERFRSHMENK